MVYCKGLGYPSTGSVPVVPGTPGTATEINVKVGFGRGKGTLVFSVPKVSKPRRRRFSFLPRILDTEAYLVLKHKRYRSILIDVVAPWQV